MKNLHKAIFVIIVSFLIISCKDSKPVKAKKFISDKVDDTNKILHKNIFDYKVIATIDHHRMAKEVGVYTPPSIATIFSDPKTNASLLQENQLLGLDLPFKILCYSEADTTGVNIAYTSSEFISKRHGIAPNKLKSFNAQLNKVLATLPTNLISNTDIKNVTKEYGIINLESDYDFDTTVKRLKKIVMSQGDTKWFADINFQKESTEFQINIRPTQLLLFGAPAPGGKAMMTTPKIGLDAFCQKLLVYEDENQKVHVAYNDIVAFAKLYYKTATKPQQMINQRLKMTFTKVIKKE